MHVVPTTRERWLTSAVDIMRARVCVSVYARACVYVCALASVWTCVFCATSSFALPRVRRVF